MSLRRSGGRSACWTCWFPELQAARAEPFDREVHSVPHAKQPGVGRADPRAANGAPTLEVVAEVVEQLRVIVDVVEPLPCALAVHQDGSAGASDPRAACPVLGEVEAGAAAIPRPKEQDERVEVVETGERRALAERKRQLMLRRDNCGVRAQCRER